MPKKGRRVCVLSFQKTCLAIALKNKRIAEKTTLKPKTHPTQETAASLAGYILNRDYEIRKADQ